MWDKAGVHGRGDKGEGAFHKVTRHVLYYIRNPSLDDDDGLLITYMYIFNSFVAKQNELMWTVGKRR